MTLQNGGDAQDDGGQVKTRKEYPRVGFLFDFWEQNKEGRSAIFSRRTVSVRPGVVPAVRPDPRAHLPSGVETAARGARGKVGVLLQREDALVQVTELVTDLVTLPGNWQLTVTSFRPSTLGELLALMAEHPGAKVVVGNTELGVEMKFKNCHYPVMIQPSRNGAVISISFLSRSACPLSSVAKKSTLLSRV